VRLTREQATELPIEKVTVRPRPAASGPEPAPEEDH
jgi:3-oxoacid CoA-transferase subunit A